jgi:hypothetical protein
MTGNTSGRNRMIAHSRWKHFPAESTAEIAAVIDCEIVCPAGEAEL